MASDQAPIPFPLNPIYNPNDWIDSTNNNNLDIAYLNANYLKYPIAQGLENLQAIVVSGSATFNSSVSVPNNDMFVRGMRIGLGGGNQVRNTMIGVNNGNANTTGNNNTFIGALCGTSNTTGRDNVFVGTFSGINNTSGFQNTFIGIDAGNRTTTGSRNTHLGRQAGYYNTGDNNICIGDWADASGNISNSIAIGVDVKATASNTIVLGSSTQKTILSGGADISRPLLMNDTTSSANRTVTSSFYNFYDSGVNSPLTQNGTLYNQSGSMYLQNTTNGGNINFVLNDAGGVQNTPLQLLSSGNLSNRPLTISANNSLTMLAGTGRISQPTTVGDTSTMNSFKLSEFLYNGNNANGTATSFTFYDSFTARGLYILPSSDNGIFGSTNRRGDCCLTSRGENTGAITISNYNTNVRNGLRVFTTDVSNCGLTLQCGQNSTNDWTEFAMNYTRTGGVNTTTTTFNNVINFNPTTPFATPPSRRRLEGLGTLSFTDVSGNGTTNGTTTSSIYTDSNTTGIGLSGMIYDCSMGNASSHIFRVSAGGSVKSNALIISPQQITSRESLVFTSTSPNDRYVSNVGTIEFLDLSGNTTQGSVISSIYTDSSLVDSIGGMYYQNNINSGYHIFQSRDASGVLTSPIYYGSNITSVSNTFIVRNAITTSNRLDFSADNAQNFNIRARSSTASTNAIININCDTVDATPTISNNPVLNIAPTYFQVRRPIQFSYLSSPTTSSQLGFSGNTSLTSSALASQTSPNNLGSITLPAGTWNINALFSFQASANHSYSTLSYAIGDSSTAFPTSLPWTLSYMREPNTDINSTTITRFLATSVRLTSSTQVYFIEQGTFTGGGTTTYGITFSYTRIG